MRDEQVEKILYSIYSEVQDAYEGVMQSSDFVGFFANRTRRDLEAALKIINKEREQLRTNKAVDCGCGTVHNSTERCG